MTTGSSVQVAPWPALSSTTSSEIPPSSAPSSSSAHAHNTTASSTGASSVTPSASSSLTSASSASSSTPPSPLMLPGQPSVASSGSPASHSFSTPSGDIVKYRWGRFSAQNTGLSPGSNLDDLSTSCTIDLVGCDGNQKSVTMSLADLFRASRRPGQVLAGNKEEYQKQYDTQGTGAQESEGGTEKTRRICEKVYNHILGFGPPSSLDRYDSQEDLSINGIAQQASVLTRRQREKKVELGMLSDAIPIYTYTAAGREEGKPATTSTVFKGTTEKGETSFDVLSNTGDDFDWDSIDELKGDKHDTESNWDPEYEAMYADAFKVAGQAGCKSGTETTGGSGGKPMDDQAKRYVEMSKQASEWIDLQGSDKPS